MPRAPHFLIPHTLLAPRVLGCAGAHLTAKAVHHRDRLERRCVMVMTIRVMSSGRGYEYLMKSVATGDTARESGTPLTRYYTETGCPPGTWLGSGLDSLDTGHGPALADGDTVTEEQLERLLGQGVHPLTGAKLGSRFPRLRPPAERMAARIDQLDPRTGCNTAAERDR